MNRTLAAYLLDHAARVMPPSRRVWIAAMRAELDHIPDPLAAAAFALGCVHASYSLRIVDVITLARMSRWALAALAVIWSIFSVGLASLMMAIKSTPNVKPEDLGRAEDDGQVETLRFILGYPAWELAVTIMIALVVGLGAVQLVRRKASALPLLALGVGPAIFLALYDRRLPDPAYNRPLDSNALLIFWLLCLAVVWWLSRRAPDLKSAA